MNDFRFRCSSLATLMTTPKSIDPALLDETSAAIAAKKVKSPEDQALLEPLYDMTLSAGAKTYVEELVKEAVYGFHDPVSTKYTTKGTIVENDSIALYNERFFTQYAKNTERRTNAWITGECDIDTGVKIIDIKSSWSLKTFPVLVRDAHDNQYEWQVRGYMWLYEREQAEVAFCMVDTPEELIGYENPELHLVERVPLELRITRITYQRDRALETRIARKVEAARAYGRAIELQIHADHQP